MTERPYILSLSLPLEDTEQSVSLEVNNLHTNVPVGEAI